MNYYNYKTNTTNTPTPLLLEALTNKQKKDILNKFEKSI